MTFVKFDYKDIKLWKVNISPEKFNLVSTKINVNIEEELGGEKLPINSKISKHFPSQPADDNIHILVQRLTEVKEVHITATYNRIKKIFQWKVTREIVSMAELKKMLRGYFEFPDGTEDKHIVIDHVMGGVKRRTSTSRGKKTHSHGFFQR
jgi:hypothetical protein